jgi:hypothetical protein
MMQVTWVVLPVWQGPIKLHTTQRGSNLPNVWQLKMKPQETQTCDLLG